MGKEKNIEEKDVNKAEEVEKDLESTEEVIEETEKLEKDTEEVEENTEYEKTVKLEAVSNDTLGVTNNTTDNVKIDDTGEIKEILEDIKRQGKDKNKFKLSKKLCIASVVGLMAVGGCLLGFKALPNKQVDGEFISSRVDNFQTKNPYIQLGVGEEQYIYFLYNGKGEAIAESSLGGQAFYRNDNKIVTMSEEEVVIDTDLNPLSFIKAVAQVVDNGYGTLETTTESNGNKLYTLKVEGKENIRKVYEVVGDYEYTDSTMDMLLNGFEDKIPTLFIRLSESDSNGFGAMCSMQYGTEEEYTSWVFDGYIPTFEWELDKEWYSNNTSDIEKWLGLCTNLVEEIGTKMNELMGDSSLSDSLTGSLTAEEFKTYTNDKQLEVINNLRADLGNMGLGLSCSDTEILNALNTYIEETGTTNSSVLNMGIHLGGENNWLEKVEGKEIEE